MTRGKVRLVAFVMAATFVLVVALPSIAMARVDAFGGTSFAAPYAPYTAGPVVHEDVETRPYVPLDSWRYQIR